MSDVFSHNEIDAMINNGMYESRKRNILREIETLKILDIDIAGGLLNLDAIESVIKTIKRNQKRLIEESKE